MKKLANTLPLLLLSGFMLAGCTSTDPRRVENDFGESVRQMINAQLYDPEAAADPPLIGVDTLDGPTAATTIDNYRRRSVIVGADVMSPGAVPVVGGAMVSQ